MKIHVSHLLVALPLLALSTLNSQLSSAHAQGTAFTYQGQLQKNGSLASGTYNLTFRLFTNSVGSSAVAGPVTNSGVVITNGLFTVMIDFGTTVWNGETNWLEIGVETNGVATFTTLTPRQEVTPTPYAIFAEGANAAGLNGTIPMTSLSGTYGGAVNLSNSGNSFAGNGSGLLNLNASTLGGLSSAAFWKTNGNAGANPANGAFLGTTDNNPLELHVNGLRGWRLEPVASSINYSNVFNVVGGPSANFVAPGVFGATIAGGGAGFYYGSGSNSVTAIFGTVSGGVGNSATNEFDTVGGGEYNTAGGYFLGGATVAGGEQNIANGVGATVGGGAGNCSTNYAATVSGGQQNVASGAGSFVGGGGSDGAIGQGNTASGPLATISGGMGNVASGDGSVVGGGGYLDGVVQANIASGNGATVGGGYINEATAQGATVPGGAQNLAAGTFSLAAGYDAQALNDDTFVWSDGNVYPFSSTAADQFLIHANGGVGIGTNAPQAQLHVTSNGGNSFPQAQLDQQNPSDYSRLRFTINGNVNKRWDVGTTATNFVIYSASIGANMIYLDQSGLTVKGVMSFSSDRNVKAGFEPVDAKTVLERVAAMPITRWHYTNDVATPHLGPMAQDFHAAFGLNGADDKHIATVDEDGVALAAIQGLNQKLNEKDAEIQELKQRLEALEKIVLNQKPN